MRVDALPTRIAPGWYRAARPILLTVWEDYRHGQRNPLGPARLVVPGRFKVRELPASYSLSLFTTAHVYDGVEPVIIKREEVWQTMTTKHRRPGDMPWERPRPDGPRMTSPYSFEDFDVFGGNPPGPSTSTGRASAPGAGPDPDEILTTATPRSRVSVAGYLTDLPRKSRKRGKR